MLKLFLVSALWCSLESVRLQEVGVDDAQTPDKLEEQREQLDLVVAARQSRVDKLVKQREAFEKEMSDKLQENRVKDEAGKEEEASRLHIIKNAQEERQRVKLEIANLTQKIAKDDFQRQRKIYELNDVLQNMQIHVDGVERPVVAKRSEEEALQQMIDEASEERSGIDAAISANMQLKDAARAEEAMFGFQTFFFWTSSLTERGILQFGTAAGREEGTARKDTDAAWSHTSPSYIFCFWIHVDFTRFVGTCHHSDRCLQI